MPGRVRERDNTFEAVRQQSTQPPSNRLHTLVLEQMDQRAKLAMVATVGHSFHKGRRS